MGFVGYAAGQAAGGRETCCITWRILYYMHFKYFAFCGSFELLFDGTHHFIRVIENPKRLKSSVNWNKSTIYTQESQLGTWSYRKASDSKATNALYEKTTISIGKTTRESKHKGVAVAMHFGSIERKERESGVARAS
jgi:hypothetical protein